MRERLQYIKDSGLSDASCYLLIIVIKMKERNKTLGLQCREDLHAVWKSVAFVAVYDRMTPFKARFVVQTLVAQC